MTSKRTQTFMLRITTALLTVIQATTFLIAASPGPNTVLPYRLLLVASEGLYVVERDGTCSWSYNVPPMDGVGAGVFDDLVYDGQALPDGRFLYATHRYLREIDRQGETVWEYRVTGSSEVKSFVLRPDGSVAVLHSGEQAIFELERGTGKVLRRIPLPAAGSNHTRYNYLRRTPADTYLVALRAENRFVEVDRNGDITKAYAVPDLPAEAQRLTDGSLLCSGRFGVIRLNADGQKTWSLVAADVRESLQLLLPCGVVPLDNGRLLVVNSDWHYQTEGANRAALFIVDQDKHVEWTLDIDTFEPWKRSEIDPHSGFTEHRCMVVQVLPETEESHKPHKATAE